MNLGWKVVDIAAVAFAGLISDNIVKAGWKLTTGHNPPADDDLEIGIAELLIFAATSGMLLAIIKRFTLGTASKWWNKKNLTKA